MIWRAYAHDPALAAFTALEENGNRLLIRHGYEAYAGQLGPGGVSRPEQIVGGGRQTHPVVMLPNGERAVVRTYLRGGVLRHLNRARYFRGHRAIEELRATERARAGGVRTAEILAAAECPRGIGYTAALATRWIPDATEGAAWLARVPTCARLAMLTEAGRQIARMHTAGVAHPDLNLRNLLVREREREERNPDSSATGLRVYLLDFDRARIFSGPVPRDWRARDLRRLARSARKLRAPVEAQGWAALRKGYGPEWPLRSALG